MASRVTANTGYQLATLFGAPPPVTMMLWWYMDSATVYQSIVQFGSLAFATDLEALMYGPGGLQLNSWTGIPSSGPDLTPGSTLAVGSWYHIAVTSDGSTAKTYLNGVLDITRALNSISTPMTLEFPGITGAGDHDARIAAVKMWTAPLSEAEIQAEMPLSAPVRSADLFAWWPLYSTADDETDYSGNGYTLTVIGTPTTIDGPPIDLVTGDLDVTLGALTLAATGLVLSGSVGALDALLGAITLIARAHVGIIGEAQQMTLTTCTGPNAATIAACTDPRAVTLATCL